MARMRWGRLAGGLGIVVLAGAAYLAWWPVPITPVAWTAPAAPGYQGVHAPNQRLAGLRMIDLKGEIGPEHIALGRDGRLYAAVLSGNILRMNPDGSGQEVFANTGGRVLGFDFDAAGHLIAADAVKGLLSIAPDGKVSLLTDQVASGDPIRYADGVVVAKSGKMYLSDASTRFAPKDWGGTFEASVLDILEQASTGRVLEYDPATRSTRVVARGISFANGVALSQDEKSLFVNETGKYRVWKVAVEANGLDIGSAPQGEQARVLFDNLPGYPDNLMRSLTLRLPRVLWPIPRPYGHVIAFTDDGKVVADLQDPAGAYPETTAITETADRLYVQSLHAKGLGWLPKDVLKAP